MQQVSTKALEITQKQVPADKYYSDAGNNGFLNNGKQSPKVNEMDEKNTITEKKAN